MKMIRKKNILISIIILVFLLNACNNRRFNKDDNFAKYNITKTNEDSYIDFLKQYIYPASLRKYIKNEYINLNSDTDNATGNDIIYELYNEAYENLFIYFFNKNTVSFDDCPVTDNFKQKYKTNLLDYFNLRESEDCESDCLLNIEEKTIVVEVYGNFKNTEPTYWKAHHFKYKLDNEGKVDDVIFDYTE